MPEIDYDDPDSIVAAELETANPYKNSRSNKRIILCSVCNTYQPYHAKDKCFTCYHKNYNETLDKTEVKDYNLKHNYGLSLVEFNLLLEVQNYKCAICKDIFSSARTTHVDHDHKSKRIRGLLCSKCNLGIGSLRTAENLRNAVIYMEKF